MFDNSTIQMDYIAALDIDPDDIAEQSNMVRLTDDVALKLAIMDAVTPGRTTKRSLVCEAVESYYDSYFSKIDEPDPFETDGESTDNIAQYL
ncbi:hypothetical protein OB955_04845 [Halobacteria archaeon AArc-m2/3/4]|uniref:Uncharacterized protein n=1 Tax=Natronoglomus mannanivorans TaxID=2979990 RepID=A0ABT2QAV8_9EURY|nr:hypothetical protein [Halobacteria archaeon AArc-m2/3/4]